MRGDADADAPPNAEAARALLAAWKRDQASLRARFDAGDDGVIDAEEWESARRAAMQEVAAERRRRLSEPGIPVLGRPSDTRLPFLLFNMPPWRLSKRNQWQAGGALTVFLLPGPWRCGW